MRRIKVKKIFCLMLIFLMVITGCSGKTPIQKYKATIDKKDIKVQIKAIEALKETIAKESDDENFIIEKQQILSDMDTLNQTLIKSFAGIKIKDPSIKVLHNNLIQYTTNNEIILTQSKELLTLYQELLDEKDQKPIEETYGKIVQTARTIDNLSQQTENYRTTWEESLITMDIKEIQ